jgi:hypothetical protein
MHGNGGVEVGLAVNGTSGGHDGVARSCSDDGACSKVLGLWCWSHWSAAMYTSLASG